MRVATAARHHQVGAWCEMMLHACAVRSRTLALLVLDISLARFPCLPPQLYVKPAFAKLCLKYRSAMQDARLAFPTGHNKLCSFDMQQSTCSVQGCECAPLRVLLGWPDAVPCVKLSIHQLPIVQGEAFYKHYQGVLELQDLPA